MHTLELNDLRVPKLGLGTWQLKGAGCIEAVNTGLALGYRHLDTAAAYGNEAEVGKGLLHSGVAREQVFITSKLWFDDMRPENVIGACKRSLDKLGIERLDLMLIHWPNPDVPFERTLDALVMAQQQGLVAHFGVSNFPMPLLKRALSHAPIRCIQVECHPYLQQKEIRDFSTEHHLMMTAYSPLARGKVMDDAVLRKVGEPHDMSPAQVAIRYLTQLPNVVAIPKASNEAHLRSNLKAMDFALDNAEMATLAELDRNERLIDPDFAPDWNME